MSIDTTFKPQGPTTLVGVTAVQVDQGQAGSSTIRVRCLVTAYLTWGVASTITAAGAPGATPVVNTVGLTAGTVETFEIPIRMFFISSVAAAFEVTPGMGS